MGLTEAKEEFLKWYPMNAKERRNALLPRTIEAFATAFQVNLSTVKGWRKEFNKQAEMPDDMNPEDVLKRLFDLSQRSPQAAKYFLDFTKPPEEKFELSAEDIIAASHRIIRRIQDAVPEKCRGSCPLLFESALFYDPLCVDSEPEHGEDSQVAAVDVPDGLADDTPDLPDSGDN